MSIIENILNSINLNNLTEEAQVALFEGILASEGMGMESDTGFTPAPFDFEDKMEEVTSRLLKVEEEAQKHAGRVEEYTRWLWDVDPKLALSWLKIGV